jgi:hypothetical protein
MKPRFGLDAVKESENYKIPLRVTALGETLGAKEELLEEIMFEFLYQPRTSYFKFETIGPKYI